jgi:hypothetical protein
MAIGATFKVRNMFHDDLPEFARVLGVSMLSLISMETFKAIAEPIAIILQLTVGFCTVIYLIKKIIKK